MSMSTISSTTNQAAGLGLLRAANEQPKLALELILQTVEANSKSTGQRPTSAPPAVSGKGQVINITA